MPFVDIDSLIAKPTAQEPGLLPEDPDVQDTLLRVAKEKGMPPEILFAIAKKESQYDPNARYSGRLNSHASGMFQYQPQTAASLGIDPMDYEQAARATADAYLSNFKKYGSAETAVALHHAGLFRNLAKDKVAISYAKSILGYAAQIKEA